MLEVLYEDNHIIVVNKKAGDLVQGDKTGDKPLGEFIKSYLREKYNKPGNIFCGVIQPQQILFDNPPSTNSHVTNFRITDLSVWQPNIRARCRQKTMRTARP